MCGIAGVHRFDGGPVDHDLLAEMGGRLHHRGPDGEGRWVGTGTGFAHQRLSIIDPAGSQQPMQTADGRYVISFNGEILNYRELRGQLSYDFTSRGDTEVLLALLAQHGPSGIRRARGQFAIAFTDTTSGDLYLFRDRLGILPLYYHVDGSRVIFGSEIKAVLPGLTDIGLDHDSLPDYLTRRSVAAPFTLIRGVRKVRPGAWVRFSRDGVCEEEVYWSPPEGPRLEVDPHQAVESVADALGESVRSALIADVPVGAFLSGGIDSSLITALAVERHGGPLHTFSAGFGDPRDEVGYARQVSRHLGTRHHEVTVSPADLERHWERLTWHRDGPLSEPADVAVYLLARAAREHVKVVLSGEGSDELFAGYPKHRWAPTAETLRRVSPFTGASLERASRWLPSSGRRARVALRASSGGTTEERIAGWFAPFTGRERERLLRVPTGERRPRAVPAGSDLVERMLRDDVGAWLPDNLLERGDRMCMAASLELRPPFLDHRLVELAFRLPSDIKIRQRRTKWVVKQVARRHLPGEIVDRPKAGFRVPLDVWFRTGLREMANDLLLSRDSVTGELFAREEVQRLLSSHQRGRSDESIRIWTLVGLEVWARSLKSRTPDPYLVVHGTPASSTVKG